MKRSIAISDLFERKREAYHEQGRAEIRRHLLKSKQRLAELEKLFKLAEEKKALEKQAKASHKRRMDLPSHLQNGADNNFKVDESLKSCWYDRVAHDYLRLRSNKKDKNVVVMKEHVQSQHLNLKSQRRPTKKESLKVQNDILLNIMDAPPMSSLQTCIEMNDDTLYYVTKYEYDLNTVCI